MLRILIDIIIYAGLGAVLAWIFFYWRKKDLIGGFWGAFAVGLLGAILGTFLFGDIMKKVIAFLERGFYISNVNVIAGLIGGYCLLYIANYVNHDKERK